MQIEPMLQKGGVCFYWGDQDSPLNLILPTYEQVFTFLFSKCRLKFLCPLNLNQGPSIFPWVKTVLMKCNLNRGLNPRRKWALQISGEISFLLRTANTDLWRACFMWLTNRAGMRVMELKQSSWGERCRRQSWSKHGRPYSLIT